jgi:hypothetical protein
MITNARRWFGEDKERTLGGLEGGASTVGKLLAYGIRDVVVDVKPGDSNADALGIFLPHIMTYSQIRDLLCSINPIETVEDEEDETVVWLRYEV